MSLRARLLWIALLATALPAVLQLMRFLDDREQLIASQGQRLVNLAQRVAGEIDERILGTAQLHYGLARARDLVTADRAACSEFLSQVREAYPQYTGILSIKPDGQLFCDSLRTGRNLDLRGRRYFQAALQSPSGVVLEPTFGRLTGTAVMQIAYPVRDARAELQFVLLASLNLQKLASAQSLPIAGSSLLLLDRDGLLLAAAGELPAGLKVGESAASHPVFAQTQAASLGEAAEISGPQGQRSRWARAEPSSAGAGLIVLAGVPQDQLLADANQHFAQDMALLAVGAVAVFLLVWWVAEVTLRHQVSRITDMARRLAEGDLGARIEPPLPSGELGSLMEALNHTARSLQQQREDIGRLNARLTQSQRLQAVGQLTGGVAHDFNNLLTVVLGNAELLAEQNHDRPQQKMLADMIGTAAQRGAELTGQLLAFARKQALDPRPADVNQLVAALDPMLRRTLGEHIEIELVRGAGLWQALVDAGQLDNALLNLCLNARDAMPTGGRLTLETANAALDRRYCELHPDVTPGQYVMLAVSDTGSGIAPEHLDRVFEPFFTTKDKGKGTGLGLAMVYGFVKQSAGHISIYSEPGQGTTVKLYLPRATAAGPAAEAVADAPPIVGGAEVVLVVEDDDLVRRYAANELRSLGYRVLEADNGAAALAQVRQCEDIQLLFTDVVMPGGMSGRQLADAARALRPTLPVLYTSGYTENAIVHHGRLDPGVSLLAKPYRRAELARAVRDALRG